MKKWILMLFMGLRQAQMPGSEMDARFLTDEEREERQENPPDGLGMVLFRTLNEFRWLKIALSR